MLITTTPEISGKTITEYKGIVFGEEVGTRAGSMGFNIQKNMLAFENMMAAVKQNALNKLIFNAEQCGANAIVGTSFAVSFDSASIVVSATGTAVIVE
jgi:Uncharacterized conserved protein